ncbi:MAG: hypothetical protein HYY11_03090 [Candidatus Methylomirabilis oxyfera]|nr:hypothetical protein [Candidatus Methylomirabilis oxyfera]
MKWMFRGGNCGAALDRFEVMYQPIRTGHCRRVRREIIKPYSGKRCKLNISNLPVNSPNIDWIFRARNRNNKKYKGESQKDR